MPENKPPRKPLTPQQIAFAEMKRKQGAENFRKIRAQRKAGKLKATIERRAGKPKRESPELTPEIINEIIHLSNELRLSGRKIATRVGQPLNRVQEIIKKNK